MEKIWLMKKIDLPNIGHSEDDEEDMIRIVVISDTHGAHKRLKVPPGSYQLNIFNQMILHLLLYTLYSRLQKVWPSLMSVSEFLSSQAN